MSRRKARESPLLDILLVVETKTKQSTAAGIFNGIDSPIDLQDRHYEALRATVTVLNQLLIDDVSVNSARGSKNHRSAQKVHPTTTKDPQPTFSYHESVKILVARRTNNRRTHEHKRHDQDVALRPRREGVSPRWWFFPSMWRMQPSCCGKPILMQTHTQVFASDLFPPRLNLVRCQFSGTCALTSNLREREKKINDYVACEPAKGLAARGEPTVNTIYA
ncbi:hypothetical protein C8R47DRAFT_1077086 [Mycena vitilis]|nr:hypothetical protein C8R47DRAFT_1077086 [Mycena vitilis]